ncbi:alkaline phosphatase D family protein [Sphingomonas sp. Leaf21]|uniref:alkaline phosphatase D family protein n=1 Tax=Sphingomonas sp. Leaf21 TaxID=2876550 RepID=UPI001E6368BD|nr:alkaline phosphatase D family protein [Sphingomonas sp. Leaf21]
MALRLTRRQIVAAPLIAAPFVIASGGMALMRGPGDPIFSLGVASGEPSPDGMVLWTRLAPQPLEPLGGLGQQRVPVRWEVATDAAFRNIVRAGEVRSAPEDGHSIHVEVDGLRPGRDYHYRFLSLGQASPVGRTRTAPQPGAGVERLRICYGSCQKYEVGHYAAWTHAVADDPDLILFLGDYIYEGAPNPKALRPHRNPEPVDLPGYRVRYASYKLDPLLQAAHAAAPWMTIWDDHEVANDYAGPWDERYGDPAQFLRRRTAAYQAYWEHMPLRRASHPAGPWARLYRRLDWGRLARIALLDDRQYRDDRPCQPAPDVNGKRAYDSLVADCPARHDPKRSMLGARQERWLNDELASGHAGWNILAQQTLMTPFPTVDPKQPDKGAVFQSVDRWQGFPAARDRIFRRWVEARTPNPIVLSGDIHAFAATDLRDPERADGPPIASEFVGGSITSLNPDPLFKPTAEQTQGFHYAENFVCGYGRLDLTPDRCEVTFRGLADARDPNSTVTDLKRFIVTAGRPGLQIA